MFYLLDIHHKPAMVVLATENREDIDRVGEQYANQVGRPLVVASGPSADQPHFKPAIPTLAPSEVLVPGHPQNVLPPHPEGEKTGAG